MLGEYDTIGMGLIVILIGVVMVSFPIVRRLHDINASGIAIVLFFIPIVNLIAHLVLLFKAGTEGPNNYGPAPS